MADRKLPDNVEHKPEIGFQILNLVVVSFEDDLQIPNGVELKAMTDSLLQKAIVCLQAEPNLILLPVGWAADLEE